MMEIMFPLVDNAIVPMNAETYAHAIREIVEDMEKKHGELFIKHDITLSKLQKYIPIQHQTHCNYLH